MGAPEEATNKLNVVVKAVSTHPLFHAALPFAAAVLMYAEGRWPSVKEFVAGALLFLTRFGTAAGPVLAWFAKRNEQPAEKQ